MAAPSQEEGSAFDGGKNGEKYSRVLSHVRHLAGARENDAAVKGEVAYDGVQSAGGQRLEAITWLPRLLLLLRINPPGDGTRFSR